MHKLFKLSTLLLVTAMVVFPADDFLINWDVASTTSTKVTIQQQATNSRQVSIIGITLLCGAAVASADVTMDRDGTAASGVTAITPAGVTSGAAAIPRFTVYGASNNTAGTVILPTLPMPCGSYQELKNLDNLTLSRNGSLYNYSIRIAAASATRMVIQLKVRQQ